MKVAVVTFPGSNCDQDLISAVRDGLGEAAVLVPHTATSLAGADAVFLPGGFSYGDYLRCGAIASRTPIMAAVKAFAQAGGPVLGICNGFQILTEAGLLPGTLQRNAKGQFVCDWTTLEVLNTATPFTNQLSQNTTIRLPIAHGDGNFYCDATTFDQLQQHHQIVFKYTDNPNGSVHNIAGITNQAGNVLGMMPHPERAMDELLGGADGRLLLQSLQTTLLRMV
ncbi:phosphoribosylformylglycinamidine synthase 1 [Secundilactobacillus kimchicus JCM 15530]|uniref:Phosphoribosylformylglycinamidine synthase subunit PurQ n=1 Tax=Secundilactobacillus kimchicus JCM 15530 TaxID=1302272 RepID=A0A0R1I047_9LACO|nr:phosphoribosylformylglycinamidine synthase subunit PurQ [Secundilactobacillus kimchicus]KRK49098.1 phosphoribosylformylglycinamidine synthase 1 [Secundilactobacillus kimchicus JCM 15530]